MRLPRWKKEQKQRKEKKRFRLARKIFLIICLTLLLGISYQVWGSLKKSLWDGKSRLTLALNSSPILVASFDPSDKTLNFLSIPPNTYIETIHGYGFYKAESIWKLGELEKYGGELLAGSLQEYLGVPVDAYASISNTEYQTPNIKHKGSFLAMIQSLLRGENETDLTRWDLIRLWWGVRGVRFDKVNLIDLGETNAVKKVILPDGTPALEPDPLRLNQLVSRLFSDRKIKEERISIGVYNGTEYPGLAKKAARIINNIGGQVIEVGDRDKKSEKPASAKTSAGKCELRSEKKFVNSYTTRKIMKIFVCQYEIEKMGEMGLEIAVILGEDYWQKLMEK